MKVLFVVIWDHRMLMWRQCYELLVQQFAGADRSDRSTVNYVTELIETSGANDGS